MGHRPGGALYINSTLKLAPGGIDSLRSPLLGPSLGLAPSGPTQALFKNAPGIFVRAARPAAGLSNWLRQLSNPGRGFSSPPGRALHAKKKPAYKCELLFEDGGEGGIDSLRSPCGQPGLRPVCPTGCASCRTPVGGSHPPQVGRYMRKKSPHINASFSSKMAVRGGLTRCARPAGSPACGRSVQLAAPVVEPRSGVLIPPR